MLASRKSMSVRVGTAKSDDGQIDLQLDRPVAMGGKGNGARIPENVAIDSGASFGPSKRTSGRIRIAVLTDPSARHRKNHWCIAPIK